MQKPGRGLPSKLPEEKPEGRQVADFPWSQISIFFSPFDILKIMRTRKFVGLEMQKLSSFYQIPAQALPKHFFMRIPSVVDSRSAQNLFSAGREKFSVLPS